jgi:hypothetical protein
MSIQIRSRDIYSYNLLREKARFVISKLESIELVIHVREKCR